jgi:hypothetical protein
MHRHEHDRTHPDHHADHAAVKPGYPGHPEQELVEDAREEAVPRVSRREPEDHDHGAHDKHEGHSVEMFRSKFWLSLALTIPVVFWSEHVQMHCEMRGRDIPLRRKGEGPEHRCGVETR